MPDKKKYKVDTIGNEERLTSYQTIVSLYLHEGDLLWQRFNMFLVAHSIFLSAIGLFLTLDKHIAIVDIFLPIIGVILCFFWLIITWRGYSSREHWTLHAEEIEKAMGNEINVFTKRKHRIMGKSIKYDLGKVKIEKKIGFLFSKIFPIHKISYYVIIIFLLVYFGRILQIVYKI